MNALRTASLLAANIVATIIFIFVADVDWLAIGLLGAGSFVGGYVGARIGRKIPPTVFRVLVVIAGVVTAVVMLL